MSSKEKIKNICIHHSNAESLYELEIDFFRQLNLKPQKLTNKKYLELLTIYLSKGFEFKPPNWEEKSLVRIKMHILDYLLYWAMGWDWEENQIPKYNIELQNKIRAFFGEPELTEQQIHSYEFTNGVKEQK